MEILTEGVQTFACNCSVHVCDTKYSVGFFCLLDRNSFYS